jgi:1,4-dihydroxy-2-naphthoyl-CoA hydrolase
MSERPAEILPLEQTMVGWMGTEILEVGDDIVRGRIEVTSRVRQPYGIVHGGAMAALAETLTSMGTAEGVAGEGKIAMGQEINASFMRPISEGHVNALCRVRRKGKTAWNWEVEITDDTGRLCALLRATIAVREAAQNRTPEDPKNRQ